MKKSPSYCDEVAKKLIALLERGAAPWQKPWASSVRGTAPYNIVSGKRYKGINSLNLMTQPFEDPRWMTFNQAQAKGARVRKNERGTSIQRWIFAEAASTEDAVAGNDQNHALPAASGRRAKMYFTTVFNAEQVIGLDPLQPVQVDFDPIERADHILHLSGATVKHDQLDRAYYAAVDDEIHLPTRRQFHSAVDYYVTALHELAHWTGHTSRLDRDILHPFGSEEYAYEELCAEIGSMMLGDELALGHDPGQHAAYVGSWIKVIQNDAMAIFRASNAAEKIRAYVLELGNHGGQASDERCQTDGDVSDLPRQKGSEWLTGHQA